MADYISKEAVVDVIRYRVCQGQGNEERRCKRGSCAYCGIMEIISNISEIPAADVQPVKKCKMIPQKTDCRGYTDVFICTNCQLHIHLGFIGKYYGGNFCLECGAEVEDGEQND